MLADGEEVEPHLGAGPVAGQGQRGPAVAAARRRADKAGTLGRSISHEVHRVRTRRTGTRGSVENHLHPTLRRATHRRHGRQHTPTRGKDQAPVVDAHHTVGHRESRTAERSETIALRESQPPPTLRKAEAQRRQELLRRADHSRETRPLRQLRRRPRVGDVRTIGTHAPPSAPTKAHHRANLP